MGGESAASWTTDYTWPGLDNVVAASGGGGPTRIESPGTAGAKESAAAMVNQYYQHAASLALSQKTGTAYAAHTRSSRKEALQKLNMTAPPGLGSGTESSAPEGSVSNGTTLKCEINAHLNTEFNSYARKYALRMRLSPKLTRAD